MAKTIIKEIIIALLLLLAIIIVLGILLYDYVPMTKTIPAAVSYTTPQEVKQELVETETVLEMTGSDEGMGIDATDLDNYKITRDYKPGKANPFASYDVPVASDVNTQSGSSNGGSTTSKTSNNGGASQTGSTTSSETGTTNNTQTTQENTTTSGGRFFQDKGTK